MRSEAEKAAAEAYPAIHRDGEEGPTMEIPGEDREAFIRGWEALASRLSPPTREELEAALADIAIPLDVDTKSWLNPQERQVIAAALVERWSSPSREAAMSEAPATVAVPPLPEELCGATYIHGDPPTGKCVFLKGHYELEGKEKHSWEQEDPSISS